MFCTSTVIYSAETAIESLLPAPGFMMGWMMDGRIETYTEETLYQHIDGEAELYFPYGFQVLGSALYVRKDDPKKGIVVNLYKMGSPLDAFGIYSYYRNRDTEQVDIGAECFMNESQLMFCQGHYFVQLSVSGTDALERTIFLAFAKAISLKLPGSRSRPKELDLIKVLEVIPRTERYVAQSVLGYAFFRKGLVAEVTLDGNSVKVFVILDDSEDAANQSFDRYVKYLKDAGIKPQLSQGERGSTITAQDPLYKGLVLRKSGRFLLGATHVNDPSKVTGFFDTLNLQLP